LQNALLFSVGGVCEHTPGVIIASALSINADRFLTLDDRQTRLAALAGLRIEKLGGD
jgi:hypothetical protein